MDKILISGAKGQLGRCLKDVSTNFTSYNFLWANKATLDITNAEQVKTYFKKHQPQYVINCAAYTAVDKAETEQELADAINVTGVQNIATACKKYNTKLLHISTDYVFDGKATKPYKPSDAISPQGVYGLSKAKGEQVLLAANVPSIIVRTSWVYSQYGHNFFKTMCRLGAEKETLNVVNDQIGCPTYAGDLAFALLEMIRLKKDWTSAEIFHYSNCGKICWYDFALKIMELNGFNCTINPIPTTDYPTPAKRPAFSLLSSEKIAKNFGLSIPWWRDSLEKCFEYFKRYKAEIEKPN